MLTFGVVAPVRLINLRDHHTVGCFLFLFPFFLHIVFIPLQCNMYMTPLWCTVNPQGSVKENKIKNSYSYR